jgi:hypothetical protein
MKLSGETNREAVDGKAYLLKLQKLAQKGRVFSLWHCDRACVKSSNFNKHRGLARILQLVSQHIPFRIHAKKARQAPALKRESPEL